MNAQKFTASLLGLAFTFACVCGPGACISAPILATSQGRPWAWWYVLAAFVLTAPVMWRVLRAKFPRNDTAGKSDADMGY